MYSLARSVCFYVPRKCRGVLLILCFLIVGISLLLGLHITAVLLGAANQEMKITEKALKEDIPVLKITTETTTSTTETSTSSSSMSSTAAGQQEGIACLPSFPKILLFIRIPKCASTSFLSIAEEISSHQIVGDGKGFNLHFNPSGAYDWNKETIKSVLSTLREQSFIGDRSMYIRHFYYVNFDDFSVHEGQPLSSFSYITIVREPVSRIVSSYLYYHFSSKPHIQRILNPKHKNESLETCIQYSHEGCTPNLMTRYFCGQESSCASGSMAALEKAKRNIERHFKVVGLLENLKETYLLYKTLLPGYFKDLDEDKGLRLRKNKNEKSMELSVSLQERIKEANGADVLLYEYIKERFFEQLRNCGIKTDFKKVEK
ncbi:PREDICTED: uronyl 2-sulfotransferase-like [Amphimedon queenslandica]|uniref:Sulfotransferase domain-containing protein n=1 Tax=Amphimedon queenslandica TaxID=400682 RepID=A0A1X7V2Y9_AMPQE|nr:PREDICTED: uronyl 2-sulfotransferase-like [Amphimedon queenslandica]|eukprot:XP_011403439.1 PREDICTED: uronyl 2-sulfotransferase-like [Amphimedon queenslandica]